MVTPTLYKFIRLFEGLRLIGYLCPAGIPTNGYGSTGPDVKVGQVWSKEYAEERMLKDAAVFTTAAASLCPTVVSVEPALSAVADFAYNLGVTRLKGSTLRRKINARDWNGARVELRKWVRGGGRVLPGLVKRREAECNCLPN